MSSGSSSGWSGNPTPFEGVPSSDCGVKGYAKSLPNVSRHPIRFFNGGVVLTETDLSVPVGGLFGHTRAYGTQAAFAYDGPSGYNWWVSQLPYIVGNDFPPTAVAVVFDSNNPYWFDVSGGTYAPRYGMTGMAVTEDTVAMTITFSQSSGTGSEVTVFNDFTHPTNPGGFVSHSDARGVTTAVFASTGDRIDELRRTTVVGGVTTTESLAYTYVSTSSPIDKIDSVTYSKQVGSGSWIPIERAEFAYYLTGDPNGSENDLKFAYRYLPNGTGGWVNVALSYYRYWLPGDPTGFAHALKMRFGPEACRSLWNTYGSLASIESQTDATIQSLADNYFEYDPATRAATFEAAAVCESCPGGGTTSDTFTYDLNPNDPPNAFNAWAYKTTQTLPDSSSVVVFSNGFGQTMLLVQKDPTGTAVSNYL